MDITDCVINKENKNEETKIEARFPGRFTYLYGEKKAPTFEEIYTHLSTSPGCLSSLKEKVGKDYEEAFAEVVITVKTESEGHCYRCNFRDGIFEYVKDVPGLADEERRRQKLEEYAAAEKLLKSKQKVKLISMCLLGGMWLLLLLLNKEYAQIVAPLAPLSIAFTALSMVCARIRFENSGGFYV